MNMHQLKIVFVKLLGDHDQVYEIKFHGNPVNKFPLKNSKIEKIKEKSKIKLIFFSAKDLQIKLLSQKIKIRIEESI